MSVRGHRWLINPLQMGSITPSSPSLCCGIAALATRAADEAVVGFGSGTGLAARALLRPGPPPERPVVPEPVPEVASHLRKGLPGVNLSCGSAFEPGTDLPERWRDKVSTAVCGSHPVTPPPAQQRRTVEAVAPGRGLPRCIDRITSPLPCRTPGPMAWREAWMPLMFSLASIWRYQPAR